MILVAFNMRPALSSLGPVLPEVMRDDRLSAAGASLLTTLPVTFLGVFGLAAPWLGRRLGYDRTVAALTAVLAAGLALRLQGGVAALFASAALAGIGIGVVNVLMPGLVKRDFPSRTAFMVGVYTMSMTSGAALAAGTVVPLTALLGGSWAAALGTWAVPALLAALVWALRLPRAGDSGAAPMRVLGLWRNRLAWQVTIYMGFQSALFYCIISWLAPMLRDRGMSPEAAGLTVSISVITQAAVVLLVPSLAARSRDQRLVATLCILLAQVGFLGLLYAPLGTAWLWTLVLGVGQGSAFGVALTVIVLRAHDARTAAALSGMAQGVGYIIASGGPLLTGLLRSGPGGWNAVAVMFVVVGAVAVVSGRGAGRALQIGGPEHPPS